MPVRNVSTKVQSGREVGSVLSAEQKKQLVKQKAKARKQREKAPRSVQDSIAYQEMFRDGICRVTDHYYTKCIQFGDINYQLAQNEDKTAVFEYWCDFYNYFDSSISDEKGYFAFENVPYGDYVVVELSAPEGYVLSDARHFVSITFDTQVIGLKVINFPIIGSVQLTKVDKDYPDNHLAGAVFEVFADTDKNGEFDAEADKLLGEMTEYEGGIYQMDELRYGKYFVKEKTAPAGFLLDENVYPFEITTDKEVVTIENEAGVGFMNQVMKGKITIFKTDKGTGDKLVGAGFTVYDVNGEKVAEGVTG